MATDSGIKRIFFLGAGATKADHPKAPLLKDLLDKILDGRNDKHTNTVKGFVSDYFFNPDNKKYLPSIQDVLSFIDIGLSDEGYFKIDKKYLETVRNSIVYCMARLIEEGLNVECVANSNLVLIEKAKKEDVIISTNYDIIIDNCFLKQYPNQINYGVRSRHAINSDFTGSDGRVLSSEFRLHFNPEQVTLLKLHGSFNWLYCQRCNELDITPARKGIFDCIHDDVRCVNVMCTERYQPLVVSPTFLKNYNNRVIKDVWSIAEKAVSEANEIIFIGYSMPSDDYQIKSMLLRGIENHAYRYGKSNKAQVTVIGKNTKNTEEKNENEFQKTNFEKVFGLINYMDCGFKEYVESL